ncbi:MAG: tol-pal system protein YbgF [Glaciecola sp.]|jgi:tol-pal system protein YbgF
MIKKPLLVVRLQLASILLVFAHGVAAQGSGSVFESQPFTPGQAQNRPAQGAQNNDALSLLLEQNQQLRTEVRALRGLLEEQGFEIRKLQKDSLNRYTNVDQRLSNLESAPITGASPVAVPSQISLPTASGSSTPRPSTSDFTRPSINVGGASNSATPSSGASSTGLSRSNGNAAAPVRSTGRTLGRGTLQPAVLSEQQLYQMAYDSVINSNFELSIAEFDQYLSVYPQGRFITNSYYWKGQAFLYLSRFEEARDSYEIIVNQYAGSAKLADAMYGLGLSYQGLGNISQAKLLLNDIKRRFPNTGVANLADTRLLSLD